MSFVIEIIEQWVAPDGRLFLRGEQYLCFSETPMVHQHQCGCDQVKQQLVRHFTFLTDGIYYHIPGMLAAKAPGQEPHPDNRTRERKEIERQSTDASQDGTTWDMVGATRKFLGVDISAKPFGDQADYNTPGSILKKLGYINSPGGSTTGEDLGKKT